MPAKQQLQNFEHSSNGIFEPIYGEFSTTQLNTQYFAWLKFKHRINYKFINYNRQSEHMTLIPETRKIAVSLFVTANKIPYSSLEWTGDRGM